MATTIITREVGLEAKGSPLTNTEVDNNFINLRDTADLAIFGAAQAQAAADTAQAAADAAQATANTALTNANNAQAALDAHILTHPAPTTRDARNQVAGDYENSGVAQGIMDTHEGAHPAPTNRDIRNEAVGVAAALDTQHTNDFTHSEIDHFNRSNLDTIEQNLAITDDVQFESLNIKYVAFNVADGLPVLHDEGTIGYDNVNKCLAIYNDQVAVTWQLGRELLMRVKNVSGDPIINGRGVTVVGVSDVPHIEYATAADEVSANNSIGIVTQDIANGAYGEVTIIGLVHGVDSSSLTGGALMYLTDDVPATGLFTTVAPSSPSYIIEMGGVLVSDPVDGVLYSEIRNKGNKQGLINFYNGAILEDHNVAVTSNGTNLVELTLSDGGSFLSLLHHGEFHKHTVDSVVALSYGTDEAPVLNYVYIPESTETLTADVSLDFPAVEQITPVATVLVQSPASVLANGCYKVHAWTDHIQDSVGQGHLTHINRWIRKQHATWIDGTLMSFQGSGTATVNCAITSGNVLQLHQQNFPTVLTPAPFYVINDFVSPYVKDTNIASLTTDSNGVTLNNRAFSIVFWGIVNQDTGDCKIMMNRPSGSYAASKPEEAAADVFNYANYSIPEEYRGVGFLLRRLVCNFNVGATILTLHEGTYEGDDLRGQSPGITGGGGGFGAGGNLPVGGATNEILAKQSAIDYDAIWIDPDVVRAVAVDSTLTGDGTVGTELSVDLEGTIAQELAIVPRMVYFVYGGSGDGGATPDATTQVSIDALTTLNVPIANIRWIYTA